MLHSGFSLYSLNYVEGRILVSQLDYLFLHVCSWASLSLSLFTEVFTQKLWILQKLLSFFYLIINNSHMNHAILVGKTDKTKKKNKKIRNAALLSNLLKRPWHSHCLEHDPSLYGRGRHSASEHFLQRSAWLSLFSFTLW